MKKRKGIRKKSQRTRQNKKGGNRKVPNEFVVLHKGKQGLKWENVYWNRGGKEKVLSLSKL